MKDKTAETQGCLNIDNHLGYNIIYGFVDEYVKGDKMNSADLVRILCKEKNISIAELARRMGQTPQNLNKKLKQNTLTTEKLMLVVCILEVQFEQSYSLPSGKNRYL